ncbi:MAG TPA: hypothetical protein ENK14_03720 [Caldithrix sp.]|nr:hypothetical protein [Caldithrix sp.]
MPGFDGTGPAGRGGFGSRGRGLRWWNQDTEREQHTPLSEKPDIIPQGIGRGGYPGGRGLGRRQGGGRGRNRFSSGSGRK